MILRRGKPLFGPASLVLVALFPPGAPTAPRPAGPTVEPIERIEQLYRTRSRTLDSLAGLFVTRMERLPALPAGAPGALRGDINRLRDAWKDVEFLAGHLDPGASARINPPPFVRVNLQLPANNTLLPPEGLQVLLEVAEAEGGPVPADSLVWLARRLRQATAELAAGASRATLEDRLVFEAAKAEVVRVMTLGITGFDTPARARALPESRRALAALKPGLAPYRAILTHRSPETANRLAQALDQALNLLKPRPGIDFDSFDRLGFIRDAGNPLLAALADAHAALGIATLADLGPLYQSPVDPRTRNLFAPDFLDAHYQARTPGEHREMQMVELGRRLFFDPVLSGSGAQSCATCHHPEKAFSDGLPKSAAFFPGAAAPGGTERLRNTPGLSTAAYQSLQFWDVRAGTLEKQIHHVIAGPAEFGTDFLAVMDRLRRNPGYPVLFRAAFPSFPAGEDPVAVGTVTKALAQFVRSLPRWNSPFDRYARGDTAYLDPAAKRGFNLFAGKAQCATCHFPPAFNGTVPPGYLETETEVLGVPVVFPVPDGERPALDPDPGRYPIHFADPYRRSFKTPGLRNVALTAPYMHNGGMKTLEDVLDFYNVGGGRGLGLDVPNQTLPADSLHLTRRERDDIVAFLKALTDTTGYGRMED